MIEDIRALLECEDKEVAAKADEVMMLTSAYEEGQISRDEYLELLEDIQRTAEVQAEGSDIQFKSMLVTGIYGILQVV
jgi:hypothetical protein